MECWLKTLCCHALPLCDDDGWGRDEVLFSNVYDHLILFHQVRKFPYTFISHNNVILFSQDTCMLLVAMMVHPVTA